MAIKKGSKVVQITLPEYHQRRLAIICERMGLSNTGVVQRWIERYPLFKTEEEKLGDLKPPSLEKN